MPILRKNADFPILAGNPVVTALGRRPFLAMVGAVFAAPLAPPVEAGGFLVPADFAAQLAECHSMSIDEGIARLIESVDGMVGALESIGVQRKGLWK